MQSSDFDMGGMNAQLARAVHDAPVVKCDCGCAFFEDAYMVKKVSGIYVGSDKDRYVDIPVIVCKKCGKVIPYMRETVEKELSNEKIEDASPEVEQTEEKKSSLILDF